MAAGDPGSVKRNFSSTAVETSLVSSIGSQAQGQSNTAFIVASNSGFPSVPFTLIVDPDTSKEEVVTVTAASSTTLTVTRGEDSTQGVAHSAGAVVRHGVSGRDFREEQTHIAARGYDADSAILALASQTHVHGLVANDGSIVGTDALQTLTRKTLTSPTITNPTITGAGVDASIVFEGATADAHETTLTVTDPTADRTITLPNATGTVALVANVLALSGGTMSGAIAMGTSKITGMGDPTLDQDATTKIYVDTILGSATAAATSATSAATSATSAATSATSAANSATAAVTSANSASTSATAAATSATSASNSATAATTSATSAAASATAAATSATSAANSATAAAASVSTIASYATSAATSATSAATSATAAATSATSAAASAASIVGDAAAAATSATSASTSASSALTSATSAATSASSASTSASSAAANAATAAASVATISGYATTASNSAAAAATSATSAATSASSAATSATAAATSAASASTSASSAATTYDSFDDRYLGAKSSNPTTDNDGDPLVTGALYFNSVTAVMQVWSGTAWGNITSGVTALRWSKTAAGGETTLNGADDNSVTLAYTVGYEQVYLNGVLLSRGGDYTASTGSSITGLTALAAGDIAEVIAFTPLAIANALVTTVIDAKGDLLVGTAADTVGRLAVGTNGQYLVADSAETTGLKFATLPVSTLDLTINAKTANYTLVAGDLNKFITVSDAGTLTITVPSGIFTAGQQVNIQRIGAGAVQIRNNGTSVLTSTGATSGAPDLRAQFSACTIICTSSNNFTVIGDIA